MRTEAKARSKHELKKSRHHHHKFALRFVVKTDGRTDAAAERKPVRENSIAIVVVVAIVAARRWTRKRSKHELKFKSCIISHQFTVRCCVEKCLRLSDGRTDGRGERGTDVEREREREKRKDAYDLSSEHT